MSSSMYVRAAWVFGLAAATMAASGCTGMWGTRPSAGEYRTVSADPRRDTEAAKRANEEGLTHLAKGELEQAAEAFHRALTADVDFGPAHNNLGKVYFRQDHLYKAAWEFELARKRLPDRAEPCNNLGLALEAGWQASHVAKDLDRAIDSYREAVKLDPANVAYQANLARALVRRGDRTEEVRSLLLGLVAKDKRSEWVLWARQQLAGMGDKSQ